MEGNRVEETLGRKRIKFLGLCTAAVVQGKSTGCHRSIKEEQKTPNNRKPKPDKTIKPKIRFWNKGAGFVLGSPCNIFIVTIGTPVLKYFKFYSGIKIFSSFATSYNK